MDLLQYLPIVFRLAAHREELDRIMVLAAPVIAEAKKARTELVPLVRSLAVELFPELEQQFSGAGTAATFSLRWLQESLNKLGANVNVDGAYGDATHKAVAKFQIDHGLVVDGWAGIKTVIVIGAELNKLETK